VITTLVTPAGTISSYVPGVVEITVEALAAVTPMVESDSVTRAVVPSAVTAYLSGWRMPVRDR
jgi:hypothetical protein